MSDPDTGYFVMSIHKHPIIPSYTLCQPATPSVIHGHHYLAAAVVNPLQITMQGAVEQCQCGFQPQNCAN